MTTPDTDMPTTAYRTGIWTVDPVHSEVGFAVRHMMVSKVRGTFRTFSAEIVVADDLATSTVVASIDLASIDTGNPQRDEHLRSPDFFDTATSPTMTYRSTGLRPHGEGVIVEGELTLKGVTHPVPLRVEFGGVSPDAYGGLRAGFSAQAQISRHAFGVDFNPTLDTGGVVVGDTVTIQLEIQAVHADPA